MEDEVVHRIKFTRKNVIKEITIRKDSADFLLGTGALSDDMVIRYIHHIEAYDKILSDIGEMK
jgi:hypothetical protein